MHRFIWLKSVCLAFFLALFFSAAPAQAADPLNVYFFRGDGCPHCAKEEVFLDQMVKKYPDLKVSDFEVYHDPTNAVLLKKVGDSLGVKIGGVPFTVIGDKPYVGYNERLSPGPLEQRIIECLKSVCPDTVAAIVAPAPEPTPPPTDQPTDATLDFNLPIFGTVNAAQFSLPLLTGIVGFLDGFNPCAMWALIFLITLLLGMENKRRRWILGVAFIVTSAVAYFLFMAAWLNIFLFLGFIVWIRIMIGLLALGSGGFNLHKFFKNPEGTCDVGDAASKRKVFDKIRAALAQKSFWPALLGMVALAFLVNLVELVCSAGLPAIYTQVLALNNLATWQYYAYLVFYIFFFMLDDLVVFFVAMLTLEAAGLSGRYARYSHLIGGILMLIVGLLLIFRPGWLMFG